MVSGHCTISNDLPVPPAGQLCNQTNHNGVASKCLQAGQAKLTEMDIDEALAQLTPLLYDVLLSRFVIGESCAETDRRHSRTEQTVSGWVREAIRQMNQFLHQPPGLRIDRVVQDRARAG